MLSADNKLKMVFFLAGWQKRSDLLAFPYKSLPPFFALTLNVKISSPLVSGFLSLDTTDTWGQILPAVVGGPMLCRMFTEQHLCNLYPVDTSSTPGPIMTTKNVSRHCQMPLGGNKITSTENHCFIFKVRWLFDACLLDSPQRKGGDRVNQRGQRWVSPSFSMWALWSTHQPAPQAEFPNVINEPAASNEPTVPGNGELLVNRCSENSAAPWGMAVRCDEHYSSSLRGESLYREIQKAKWEFKILIRRNIS